MAFKTLKKTLSSLVLAASIALAPVSSKAAMSPSEEYDYVLKDGKASHIQWMYGNRAEARATVLGFDVLFGCLKSGIGSRINDNGFWKGCAKGALGGAVMYAGEHVASYNNYPMFGGAGKLVHDLGVSMSDNVMRGDGMFSKYETELGPVTFTFDEGIMPRLSFTLTPAIAIGHSISNKQSFDAKQSLYNLTPVFKTVLPDERFTLNNRLHATLGSTSANVVSYTPMSEDIDRYVLSHEMNHVLFWSKFRFSKDLLQWVPTEKAHPSLEMEKIQRWWNIGQDIGGNILYLPMNIDIRAYNYTMPELEAHSMGNIQ